MSVAIETANESRISIETGGLSIDDRPVSITSISGYGYCDVPYRQRIVEAGFHDDAPDAGRYFDVEETATHHFGELGIIVGAIKKAISSGHEVTSSAEYLSVDTDSESIRNKSQTLFKKIGPFVVGVSEINSTWIMNGYDDKPRNSFSYKTLSIGRFGLKRALGIKKA